MFPSHDIAGYKTTDEAFYDTTTIAKLIPFVIASVVEVKSDKVIIDHASTIELGKGATEKAVLGDKLLTLFNTHTHIGNMGAPTSPPTKPMTPDELSQQNVKVK